MTQRSLTISKVVDQEGWHSYGCRTGSVVSWGTFDELLMKIKKAENEAHALHVSLVVNFQSPHGIVCEPGRLPVRYEEFLLEEEDEIVRRLSSVVTAS